MSIEAMSLVLHHSKSKGTAKLVLLGIANHEGDGGAWPSVATLMRYANMDRRNVQRAIQKLVEMGELQVLKQKGGNDMTNSALRPNLYRVKVFCPYTCDRSSQHKLKHSALPGFEWTEPDQPMSQPRVFDAAPPRGDNAAPPAAYTPPKPSLNSNTKVKEETLVIRAANMTERCIRPTGHLMTDEGCFWCGA
jgi:hypothetical protein